MRGANDALTTVPHSRLNWGFQAPQFWNVATPWHDDVASVEADRTGMLLWSPGVHLAADVSSSATTINLDMSALLDPDGNPQLAYDIAISTTTAQGTTSIEAMRVRDLDSTGTTATVDRGILNTITASHNTGDSVYIVAGFSTRTTSLNGDLAVNSQTITVTTTNGFRPILVDASGNFVPPSTNAPRYTFPYAVQVENEVMLVTAWVSANQLAVERGISGTKVAPHSSGTPLDDASLVSVGDKVFGPAGSLPSSATDFCFCAIYNDFGVDTPGFDQPRVVGFGRATATAVQALPNGRIMYNIQRKPSVVSFNDARATFPAHEILDNDTGNTILLGLSPDLALSPTVATELVPLLLSANRSISEEVLAPALVRAADVPTLPQSLSPN